MLFTKHSSQVMDALEVDCKRIMGAHETTFIGAIIDNSLSSKPPSRYICTKLRRKNWLYIESQEIIRP